jgi:hypothetical protein
VRRHQLPLNLERSDLIVQEFGLLLLGTTVRSQSHRKLVFLKLDRDAAEPTRPPTLASLNTPMERPIDRRPVHGTRRGNDSEEEEKEDDGWNFASSMTFASSSGRSLTLRRCDCDECGCVRTSPKRRSGLTGAESGDDDSVAPGESDDNSNNNNKGSYIPDAILRAIEQHRKQKRLRVSLQQTRTLRARHWCQDPPLSAFKDDHHEREDATEKELRRDIDKGKESARGDPPPTSAETAVSAWEWELPLAAEPKVEFGASHRVIWIRRCPGALQSIAASQGGGGTAMVVGSSDEESRRVTLEDWTAGTVVFVPSNGGHAVGYAHVNPKPTSTASTTSLSSFDDESSVTNDPGGSHTHQENERQEESEPNLPEAAACSPGGLYATLLVVKLPDRLLKSRQHIDPQLPSWLAPLLPICRRLVSDDERSASNCNEGGESNARSATIGPKPRYTVLNAEDAKQIKTALSSVIEEAKEVP